MFIHIPNAPPLSRGVCGVWSLWSLERGEERDAEGLTARVMYCTLFNTPPRHLSRHDLNSESSHTCHTYPHYRDYRTSR